ENLKSLVDIFPPSGPPPATPSGSPASLTNCSSICLSTDFLRREAESLVRDMKASRLSSERWLKSEPKRSKPRLLVTGLGGNLGSALDPLLQEDFEVWGLSRSQTGPRTLRGDLTLTQFGLETEEWEFLQGGIDQVLHLAALLDLSKSYSELRAANTSCLATLSGSSGQIHLASTLAVTLSAVPPSLETEAGETLVYGGY